MRLLIATIREFRETLARAGNHRARSGEGIP